MLSILEIGYADWADIWHTVRMSRKATTGAAENRKNQLYGLGWIDFWFQIVREFEGPLVGWLSGCFNI